MIGQGMNMNMNMQGFNFQNNQCPVPRLTKTEVVNYVSQYCQANTGVAVNKVQKIDDAPSSLRHSCVATGIALLPRCCLQLTAPSGVLQVYFYFCAKCGKLYIVDDYMQ